MVCTFVFSFLKVAFSPSFPSFRFISISFYLILYISPLIKKIHTSYTKEKFTELLILGEKRKKRINRENAALHIENK